MDARCTTKILGETVLSVKRSIIKQIECCDIQVSDDTADLEPIGWITHNAIEPGSGKEMIVFHRGWGTLARADYYEYVKYTSDCFHPQIFII